MKAWHFVTKHKRLGYGDGRLVEIGKTYAIPDQSRPIQLCEYGMHASVRALDALKYAPGEICCLVKLGGKIIEGDDKVVAKSRTVLKMIDVTNILHEMACISAEAALLITNVQDPRCWQAIEAKRAWVRGEISDADLVTARNAVLPLVAAAGLEARAIGRRAAWNSADTSPRNAARCSAAVAAWGAARKAAWDEQNAVLESMLREAM